MSSKTEQNPEQYQPVTDRAKAKIMEWASRPTTEQDIMTFSTINPTAVYIFSAIQAINNYKKQLLEPILSQYCNTHKETHKESDLELVIEKEIYFTYEKMKCDLSGPIIFEMDTTLRDEPTKELVLKMLLLAVSAHARADKFIDMIKNMNRPSMNPMAMLGGLGGNRESDEELIEEVPAYE